jgi:hypothetical protein
MSTPFRTPGLVPETIHILHTRSIFPLPIPSVTVPQAVELPLFGPFNLSTAS